MTTVWHELARVPHALRYVEAAGVRTRVLEAGSGRPVMLLHGTGGHLEVFSRNVGPLSEDHHVVAVDLAGHGFSESPAGFSYDWPRLAEHVLETAVQLGLERPVIVGEALGAQLAQWIAIRHPQTVSGVVLACTVIVPADLADPEALPSGLAEFQELTARALEDPTEPVMRRRLEWLLHDPSVLPDELVDLRVAMWAPEAVRDAQRELLASYAAARTDPELQVTSAEVAAIEVPVLVVWSNGNPLQPPAVGRSFAALLPEGSEYLEFEHSGMWPQFEEAARFNAAVGTFIKRLREPIES
jgi:2-hydroxy-6-oxonona-2,4-dienedioate hydrolase